MPNENFQLLFEIQRFRIEKETFYWMKEERILKVEANVWLDLENKPSAEGSISYSDFQF